MTILVLDACFLIALRESKKLNLLPKVAELLGWKLIVPHAAYLECTGRDPNEDEIKKMVRANLIEVSRSPNDAINAVRNRYSRLGKGEVEALAFILSRDEKQDSAIMVSDDQVACKTARNLGIETLGTLDFFRKVLELGLMSNDEIRKFVPTLREHMWLDEDVIDNFLASIR